MDPSNLKYTIIIPCYNSEKWLSASIESALNQTYKNVEVIVIDNESSDRSLEIAKKYSDQATIGTAKNIYKHSYQEPVEEALKLATGDYFTILGSDDFIEPTYIENLNKIISIDPSRINFLQSPLIGVQSDTGKSVGEIKHEYRSLTEFKKLLFERSPVCTPTMVFKKSLYDDGTVCWNSEKYLGASDYDLYFRLADKGYFIFAYPKWLGYYYRWHEDQATWGMHKENALSNFDNMIQSYWKEKWNDKT